VEPMSCDHVWCLTVSKKFVQADVSARLQMDEAGNFPEDIPDISSTSLLFRPPSLEKSTQFSPACSIIWMPWHSMALSECSKHRMSSNLGDETIDMFIKVFDSTNGDQKENQRRLRKK
jgi:hypothetical protein